MNNNIHSTSLFISFEGIEGSGKTTQITKLKEKLESSGKKVLCLREPGGTEFGENLRSAILNSKTAIAPLAELSLFAASRAQLLFEKILPFLEKPDHVVIVDRFIDSSIAYQGFARELGAQTVLDMHKHSPLNNFPHISFYLRISLETSMERQNARGNEKDYFEKEKSDFYQKLIDGYEFCYKSFPSRIKLVNGETTTDEVYKSICDQLISAGYLND